MGGCNRNGLCEFVRDGGNQFSHRADPARMDKIGLVLFGSFAVFNIRCRTTPLHNLPTLVPHRHGAYQEPAIDSVRSAPQPGFTIQRLASRLEEPLRMIGLCPARLNIAPIPEAGDTSNPSRFK